MRISGLEGAMATASGQPWRRRPKKRPDSASQAAAQLADAGRHRGRRNAGNQIERGWPLRRRHRALPAWRASKAAGGQSPGARLAEGAAARADRAGQRGGPPLAGKIGRDIIGRVGHRCGRDRRRPPSGSCSGPASAPSVTGRSSAGCQFSPSDFDVDGRREDFQSGGQLAIQLAIQIAFGQNVKGQRKAEQHHGQRGQKERTEPSGQSHGVFSGPSVLTVGMPRLAGRWASQQIAAAAERLDQPLAVGFELAAEFHDVDFERVRKAVVAFVPDVLINPGPREDLARMAQKIDQQGVFLGGQVEQVAGAVGQAGRQIDADVGHGQHVAGPIVAAAEHCPQPGQQFLERERLGKIIVGPAVQPDHAVGNGVAGGQQQDRRAAVDLCENAAGR